MQIHESFSDILTHLTWLLCMVEPHLFQALWHPFSRYVGCASTQPPKWALISVVEREHKLIDCFDCAPVTISPSILYQCYLPRVLNVPVPYFACRKILLRSYFSAPADSVASCRMAEGSSEEPFEKPPWEETSFLQRDMASDRRKEERGTRQKKSFFAFSSSSSFPPPFPSFVSHHFSERGRLVSDLSLSVAQSFRCDFA